MNEYNEVSNQLDATTISFINLLNQSYVFRAKDSPILKSTCWLYTQLLVQCTGRQRCPWIVPKAVYTVNKCSWV